MSIMNLKSVINLNVRLVETWYEVEKGRPLTRENLKKMRQRGNFERLVEVARRWRLDRIAQRKVTCPDQDQLDHSVRKFAP